MPRGSTSKDSYSKQETQQRFEAALRGAFNTPAKPLKSIKTATQKRRLLKKKTSGE
jgi:hypothetical protein